VTWNHRIDFEIMKFFLKNEQTKIRILSIEEIDKFVQYSSSNQ